MSEPELTLELIREGNYNTDRPSHEIISDLLEVVIFLDDKLNQNKDERRRLR